MAANSELTWSCSQMRTHPVPGLPALASIRMVGVECWHTCLVIARYQEEGVFYALFLSEPQIPSVTGGVSLRGLQKENVKNLDVHNPAPHR